MGKGRVTLKPKGVGQLLNSAGVRAELTQRAERVAAKAIADAPVKTGNYRESIHLEQDTTDRAVVRVVADAPHSHLVEADSGNLARALDAAG